MSTQEIP